MSEYPDAEDNWSDAHAIAAVEEVVARMKPWPEEIRVALAQDVGDGTLVYGRDKRFTLGEYEARKLKDIRLRAESRLHKLGLLPRLPNVYLIMGDAVVSIWSDRVGQLLPYLVERCPDCEGRGGNELDGTCATCKGEREIEVPVPSATLNVTIASGKTFASGMLVTDLLRAATESMRTAVPGTRNEQLLRCARALAQSGMVSRDHAWETLSAVALKTGMPAEEIKHTFSAAWPADATCPGGC